MPDPIFADRRLAATYDPMERDRGDLDAYVTMVGEFGARSVLDIGCGTGTFACALASQGIAVIGVEPAGASLDVARSKPHADQVHWVNGTVDALEVIEVDLVTMTANVAQVFLADAEWMATLGSAFSALRPGGRLVFETRDPGRQAWLEWNRAETWARAEIAGIGTVETWCDLLGVDGDLVTFRWTNIFGSDGATITSDSTLRFRTESQIRSSLGAAGFEVEDVRDAPDRPGRELVFVARRPG